MPDLRHVLVESRSNILGLEVRLEYKSAKEPVLRAYQLGDAVGERELVRDDGWRRGALSILARSLPASTKRALANALDEGLRVFRDGREAA